MRSCRNAPRPTRWPWTRMSRCCLGSSSVMPGMLRHQQQLLGQVDHGRMIWPGPQLDAKVANALHAGFVLDLAEQLDPSSAVGEHAIVGIWVVSWENSGRALVRRVPT